MYVVTTRALVYPADQASLAIARAAGGLSRLTPAQAATVVLTRVPPGGDCSDHPDPASLARLVAAGLVREVPDLPAPDAATGPVVTGRRGRRRLPAESEG